MRSGHRDRAGRNAPPDPRALEGRLEDLPLCDILQVLQVSAKTGGLFLTHADGRSAVILFRSGRIVQVVGTANYRPLGERLESRGVITRKQLDEASAYMASFPGMRLGDALVELAMLTRALVEAEVKAQMSETVQGLMSWNEGQFEFRVGLLWPGPEVPASSTDFVLEEGMEPQRIIVDMTEQQHMDDTAPVVPRKPKTPEEQAEEEVQALLVSLERRQGRAGRRPGRPGFVPRGAQVPVALRGALLGAGPRRDGPRPAALRERALRRWSAAPLPARGLQGPRPVRFPA